MLFRSEGAGAKPADIAAVQERIRKQFAHGGNSGAALDRADLSGQIKPLQDEIQAEDKLLAYREQVLEKYYKANLISEQGYYDTRATVIKANEARVKDLYDQEIAIVDAAAAHASDAAKKKELSNRADQLRNDEQAALLRSGEALDGLTLQQTIDTEKYRAEVEKLSASLGKLNGTAGESAGADFDRSHADLKQKATVRGDTGTLDTLAEARNDAVAQAQINDLKTEAQRITEKLGITEKQVALEEQSGQKTQLEGMILIGKARGDAAAQLDVIAQKMQAIAADSGMPQLNIQAQQFKQNTDDLSASSNVLGKSVNDTLANGFAKMLDNTINRTKTLKESFLDMANTIEQSILKMVTNDLVNSLFGIGNTSSGGWLAQLLGVLGTSGGGGTDAGVQIGGAIDTAMPAVVGALASGGPAMAGGLYEVNERGPELLNYANRTFLMMGDRGGSVTPMGGATGTGMGNQTFNMNIAVPAGTTRQSAQQQAAEIMRHAQIAQARNA